MKYLIVGLGNIGEEYANTRHNIGFTILDAYARASNIFFMPGRLADVADAKHKGRQLTFIKPATYMNLSGKAVNYWLQALKLQTDSMLVITDDIALPFGTLRLRAKGSDGGHNGLKSINEVMGTTDYARLRFGVGNDFLKGKQADYVLSPWSKEEASQLEKRVESGIEIINSFVSIGLDRTMTLFNNK